jgi:hypothetical protein
VKTAFNMKINKSMGLRLISILSTILILSNCSFLNVFSPSPIRLIRDSNGNRVLQDNRAKREDFASSMDRHIVNELANNRVPGTKNSRDWQAFWEKRLHFIRGGSENSQWYINYIIEARKASGLPKLRGY